MTPPVTSRMVQLCFRFAGQELRRLPSSEVILGAMIGRGGMSDVHYLVRVGSSEPYAAKLFRVPYNFGSFYSELRAARRIRRLGSPYLVKPEGYLVLSPDQNLHHRRGLVVTELLEGAPLSVRMAENLGRGGSLPVQRITDRFIDYLRGLRDLHSVGIVHRDIKPDNLWDPPTGPGKIIDFGISRVVDPKTGSVSLVGQLEPMGTPEYMPPESFYEALFGVGIDPRLKRYGFQADIFSMGTSFYEVLSGRLLFPHLENYSDCIVFQIHRVGISSVYANRRGPLAIVLSQHYSISEEQLLALDALDRIIGKATKFFPQDRYQTADEFLEALLSWKQSYGGLGFPPSSLAVV